MAGCGIGGLVTMEVEHTKVEQAVWPRISCAARQAIM
jgi:hypothetical protein